MPDNGEIQGEGGTHPPFQFEVTPPELQVSSTETRVEEILTDGTRVVRTYTDTQTLIRGRGFKLRSPLNKWVIIFVLAVLATVIGLISVGPNEVWHWLTGVVDRVLR